MSFRKFDLYSNKRIATDETFRTITAKGCDVGNLSVKGNAVIQTGVFSDVTCKKLIGDIELVGNIIYNNSIVDFNSNSNSNFFDENGVLEVEDVSFITFKNNVDIAGNLIIRGTTTTVSTQQLFVKDNLIEINQIMDASGNVDPSGVLPNPTDFESGIVVYRGPETPGGTNRPPYQFLYDESSNTFQVGVSGKMQPVATREEIPIHNRVPYWDSNESQFKTDRNIVLNADGSITALDFSTNSISLNGLKTDLSTNYYTKSSTDTLLNGKQETITGGATTITSTNLTASRALVSDVNGKVGVSATTSTELGYLSGVTSNIQTQINNSGSKWTTSGSNIYRSSGNVGIGITNPISKLHLNGEIIEKNVYLKNRYKKLNNYISESNAVSTWTARAAANTHVWLSVCWSPELGLFCAVAQSGTPAENRIMTSPDGINWTQRTAPNTNEWRSVCWSPELGLFCAVASTSFASVPRVMTSKDGAIWTQSSLNATQNSYAWASVCWSAELGIFCAVAPGAIMTSPDGITWTVSNSGINFNDWISVCWSPELGLFCAVAQGGGTASNRIMTSPNGTTWTQRTAINTNEWISVCWSPELGLFCAVANSGGTASNRIMASPNGTTWTQRTAPNTNSWRSVCWSPELGLFCAVANSGGTASNRIMTSPDGTTWTPRAAPNTNSWSSVCWSPELGIFCSVAFSGGTVENRVMTSTYTVPFRSNGDNIISNNTSTVTIQGDMTIQGALAKGSGSFKIDHPLKPETHHLVHSFIEGPQADLIYRGKVKLIEGKALINIDKEAGMTEGTFNALCRNVQCFTSNETDWSQVYGYVDDNILTILCQYVYSSATISWMVIAERKDRHMIETDWTDENGKVIVEPRK